MMDAKILANQMLPPPLPWRWVRRVALPMAVLIWALAVFWRAPMLVGQPRMVFVVSPLTAVPFVLVLAYGLAVIAVLFWVNRHRLQRVFRWNWGRVIGAVALAAVTPVAVFDWGMPWVLGGVAALLFVPKVATGRTVGPWHCDACSGAVVSGFSADRVWHTVTLVAVWAVLSDVLGGVCGAGVVWRCLAFQPVKPSASSSPIGSARVPLPPSRARGRWSAG